MKPLIDALCCKALLDIHWKKIKEVIGLGQQTDIRKYTLQNMNDLDLTEVMEYLTSISEKAKKLANEEQHK